MRETNTWKANLKKTKEIRGIRGMKSAFFAGHLITLRFGFEVLTKGAIHSTKISGLSFENFLGANGSRRVRKVSFNSILKKSFALIYGGC